MICATCVNNTLHQQLVLDCCLGKIVRFTAISLQQIQQLHSLTTKTQKDSKRTVLLFQLLYD